ncbi:MAG: DNA polymerase III subunit gamma/tau [Weeksellaceae bacterium]
MFYLSYRPKTISELDNTQVKSRITHLLKPDNVPHAMLFVGGKGMGKTSTARIIAKAINCLENSFAGKGESIEPCNTCSNCVSIDAGSSPDVIEQDAASNRGIDEVRKLIKESAFAPMTGRYRVYIIDEAHMITNDAFNALLKTLEEPPQSVVFMLATTNEEKVPKTIISRCVRVPFGKAKPSDIEGMVTRIATHEKLEISAELKKFISENSDNSFRDAAKLLEELITQEALDVTKAQQLIGQHGKQNFLEVLKAGELSKSMEWIQSYVEHGGNIKLLIESLLHTLHEQLLLKSKVTGVETVDLGLSLREITQLMKALQEAYDLLRISPIESLPLEIAIVEFYNDKK